VAVASGAENTAAAIAGACAGWLKSMLPYMPRLQARVAVRALDLGKSVLAEKRMASPARAKMCLDMQQSH